MDDRAGLVAERAATLLLSGVMGQLFPSENLTWWLWPKLCRYARGETSTGLNRIEKPIYNDTGEIIEFQTITDSNEMFYQLLQWNTNHFAQAHHTPFVEGCFGHSPMTGRYIGVQRQYRYQSLYSGDGLSTQ